MKIYITAILKANPAFREEVIVALQRMVEESRKEAACIQYDLHQVDADENQFIFYEIWENRTGLDAHNQQPYIQAFGEMAEEKLQEAPQIYLMEKIA
ncbi:antibiotic biosynthesis monooxygenase [Sphingobacterium sp. CZ-UAM]|uniref:putative quinol monooxygenase n=1 Tax=Sphingobacterium sp. CZ-UAM TaxID=1933868 RepID=UPI0009851626|nr:putative quinol monooxygenase [Sphingobacterium sp. CZ-UAM]OOG17823.1 antibiotic biosynthesis monooxygenase [Sphingobacterium sp. CZ-UAM]